MVSHFLEPGYAFFQLCAGLLRRLTVPPTPQLYNAMIFDHCLSCLWQDKNISENLEKRERFFSKSEKRGYFDDPLLRDMD